MLMGSDNGGIDNQVFEVWIIGHGLEDAMPNALAAPSAEAPEYTVPIAERFTNILLSRPVEPFWSGLPMINGDIRSHAASFKTKRSITPKAASPKEALNLICGQKGILRVHRT
jgi:hypothetical protein